MNKEYKFKVGEEVEFKERIVADPNVALWAQISFYSKDTGHIVLSSAKDEVNVDGHLEVLSFMFPDLLAGQYSYVAVIGNASEEIDRFTGTVIVEAQPKKKKATPKKRKKVEIVVEDKESTPQGLFTSDTFPAENDG